MDPDRARYLRTVEELFVELRGRGFMLSSRDVALVDGWREAGVPVRVVVKALEEGVARFRQTHPPGTPLPATLAYFEGAVDERAARYRERRLAWFDEAEAAGGGATGDRERVLDAIAEAGRRQAEEGAREVLREAFRAVRDAAEGEPVWGLTAEVDARIVRGLEALLGEAERAALRETAAAAVGAGRMSARARAEREAVAMAAALRERFGVPELVEVLRESDV